MCPSAYRVLGPQGPEGEGVGVKPEPKPSLDRWGCVCKIPSGSVQGFGFPLALHIPTDRQTNKHLYPHFYIDIIDIKIFYGFWSFTPRSVDALLLCLQPPVMNRHIITIKKTGIFCYEEKC